MQTSQHYLGVYSVVLMDLAEVKIAPKFLFLFIHFFIYLKVCANFYPDLIVKLVQNSLQQKENNTEIQLLQSQLTVFESTVATKYPASAKLYLQLSEPKFKSIETHCRIMQANVFNEEETCRLKDLYNCVNWIRKHQ